MSRKTVRIGRRTMPLWLLIAILVPTVIAAAWGLAFVVTNHSAHATAAPGGAINVAYSGFNCTLVAGTGSLLSCTQSGGGVQAQVANISDSAAVGGVTTRVEALYQVRNNGTTKICLTDTVTPDAYGAVAISRDADIMPGVQKGISMTFSWPGMVPGAVSDLAATLTFTECP